MKDGAIDRAHAVLFEDPPRNTGRDDCIATRTCHNNATSVLSW